MLFLTFVEKKDVDGLDLMHLKTYLHNANAHTLHPTLFKKVNDMCVKSGFQAKISQKEFEELYLNTETLV